MIDIKILNPKRFYDGRGFFSEIWNKKKLRESGIDVDFVQDNHSISYEPGVVRGLHYQNPPFAQAKLVRCGRGKIFDVAVDIRKGSPTYGQWIGEELTFETGKMIFIPVGFLHGFMTLEPNTEVIYKCSNYYAPSSDRAVHFEDPDIGIEWPKLKGEMIISKKDASAPFLSNINNPFTYKD